jgi:WLM domain
VRLERLRHHRVSTHTFALATESSNSRTTITRLDPNTRMVHLRLNEHESNPNPHVNFISALSMPDPNEQERARQLLRALAAQVRPVMKAHGFVVNSLEEVRRVVELL